MRRPDLGPCSSRFLTLATALILIALPAATGAGGWGDDDPAEATSENLEDHMAESEDPSDLEVDSQDMVTGHSEDPDDMVVDAEQAEVVDPGDLSDHRGSSTELGDLKMSEPEAGLEKIDDGRLARVDDVNLSAEQLVAKHHLERAQQDAEMARTAYGDMMRRNYPRGDARARIVEQRDDTMAALEKARKAFDEAMGK